MTMPKIPTPAIASGARDAMLKVEPAMLSVAVRVFFHASGSPVIEFAAPENEPAIKIMM